jgi:hypothetical protein
VSIESGANLPVVITKRLPEGVHGYTDGTKIFVDDRLNSVQLKCTIVHELIHIERGQGTRQLESEEMAVRYETARRLLPIIAMSGVCRTADKLSLAAKDLSVTKRVLMDRAAVLTDSEAATVGCPSCLHKCPAMVARYAPFPAPSLDQWQEQVQWGPGSMYS